MEVHNSGGLSQVCLLCEHASAFIPDSLNYLGLAVDQRESHAAWDPGALELSLRLSAALDAPLIASRISRLVYDCNRPPHVESACPVQSELIEIPGNRNLDDAARQQRVDWVYKPFCDTVSRFLDARLLAGKRTVVVTVHSFSPTFFGERRTVEIGVLHDSDDRLANAILSNSDQLPCRSVLRNKPYGPEDGVTHSLQLHAISRGLANVMLEIRNDLLVDAIGCQKICDELEMMLRCALTEIQEGAIYA